MENAMELDAEVGLLFSLSVSFMFLQSFAETRQSETGMANHIWRRVHEDINTFFDIVEGKITEHDDCDQWTFALKKAAFG